MTHVAGQLRTHAAEMLAFERSWWTAGEAKDAAIRERFGLTAAEYYQRLNALIDTDDALAADPPLVRRLRRQRSTRRQDRSARRADG